MRRLLLLLRHAKAVPATDPLTDSARPLAERGLRDAQRIGERLRQHGMQPTLVLSSPATRALQTAELVAATLGYARADIALDRRLYLAEPATLLAVIAAQAAEAKTLFVVGHNPGLTDLAHRLLPALDVDDLPTCAVVGLQYGDAEGWAKIETAAATLVYYDFPKNPGPPLTAR
jgi:phosphohistidine phosphatase